jgi:hypothetical protein
MSLHTLIFFINSVSALYVLYCGLAGKRNWILVVAVVSVLAEGLALLVNRFNCPLTNLAKRYGDNHERFTELFLPKRITPFVMPFFTLVFVVGLILVLSRPA